MSTLNQSPEGLKRRPQASVPVSPEQPGRDCHGRCRIRRLRHRRRRGLRDGAPPGTRAVGGLVQVRINTSIVKIVGQTFCLPLEWAQYDSTAVAR